MSRICSGPLVAVLVFAGQLMAQNDVRRGTIKKIDLDRMVMVLTAGDDDVEFAMTENTRVLDASGKDLKERLRAYKEGAAVMFRAARIDGKDTLLGIKLADAAPRGGSAPKLDTSKFSPLNELGANQYRGFAGGLYPNGANERPSQHEAAGLALAKSVQPLDRSGKPAFDGRIVLLSIGMSNTTQEFSAFMRLAAQDRSKNPSVVLVDGAQGGMTATLVSKPHEDQGRAYWQKVDQRLKDAGSSGEQVQAAWIKEADGAPNQGFPKYAQTLQGELRAIVQFMRLRYPNLKLIYLSSRTYGGYATTRLNPEPYAYESGFSVKWLIEEQLKGNRELNFDPAKGQVKAPWLSWGPYLWANGTQKRSDGLAYELSDFGPDGTHPSASGQRKVADLLLQFFKTDSTARPWFGRAE